MTVSCIIIDDEPVARKGIENYVERIGGLHLLGSYANPDKIDTAILAAVDLIFLDIKLHKINGLEFYKTLRPDPPFAIVISAYSEFALQGFEMNVADYLLKPVAFERFSDAVDRVKELIRLKASGPVFYDEQADYFFIKSNSQIQKVKYETILYVEGRSNYVLIYTEQQKYLSYLSLHLMVDKLPKQKFLRIHRSWVIAIDKIDSIKGNEVFIKGHGLPVGQSFKDGFMEIVEKKLLKK